MIVSPALDLAYLTAYLKKKHAVKLYDLRIHCLKQDDYYKLHGVNLDVFSDKIRCLRHMISSDSEIKQVLETTLKDVALDITNAVIISISACQQFALQYLLSAVCHAKHIKSLHPKIDIILTGNCPDKYAKAILKLFPFIDAIVFEGNEDAILDYFNLSNEVLEIPGIYYRRNQEIVSSSKERNIDINSLPTPDFSLFDLKQYKINGQHVLPYELSRGCVKNCFFCYYIHKNSIKIKDIQKVICDLRSIMDKYNTHLFHFVDAEINFNQDYLYSMAKEFQKSLPEIKWSALAIPNMNENELKALKEAGCVQLRWGVEYVSEPMLERIRKDTTKESIISSLLLAHKLGINNYITCITGLPGETEKDILDTKAFITKFAFAIDSFMECPYGQLGQFPLAELVPKATRIKQKKRNRQYYETCAQLGIKDTDIIEFLTKC